MSQPQVARQELAVQSLWPWASPSMLRFGFSKGAIMRKQVGSTALDERRENIHVSPESSLAYHGHLFYVH